MVHVLVSLEGSSGATLEVFIHRRARGLQTASRCPVSRRLPPGVASVTVAVGIPEPEKIRSRSRRAKQRERHHVSPSPRSAAPRHTISLRQRDCSPPICLKIALADVSFRDADARSIVRRPSPRAVSAGGGMRNKSSDDSIFDKIGFQGTMQHPHTGRQHGGLLLTYLCAIPANGRVAWAA